MAKVDAKTRRPAAGMVTVGLVLAAGMSWTSVSRAEYPPKGDFARGARLWVLNCGRCHDARDPKELRDDQWITTPQGRAARLLAGSSRWPTSRKPEVSPRP